MRLIEIVTPNNIAIYRHSSCLLSTTMCASGALFFANDFLRSLRLSLFNLTQFSDDHCAVVLAIILELLLAPFATI